MNTQSINAQTVIPAVISHAASRQNQLFFGSSAGAFAALNYSAQFPGSVVVAMNPRINLTHAPYTFPSFTNVVTPDLDITEAKNGSRSTWPHCIQNRKATRWYGKNMQDENYVRHHYAHFVKSVGDRDDVRFVNGDWGNGHVVPPKSTYMGRLEEAMAINAPNWFGGHDIIQVVYQYRSGELNLGLATRIVLRIQP